MPPQAHVEHNGDGGGGGGGVVEVDISSQILPLPMQTHELMGRKVPTSQGEEGLDSTSSSDSESLSSSPSTINDEHDEDQQLQQQEQHEKCRCRFGSNTVRFSSTVNIHPILHRRDMTSKEVRDAWVTRWERSQIKNVANNTVYLMKTGVGCHLTPDDYFCPRGLEHLWDQMSVHSKEEAYKSHKIALAMQRLLRRSGSDSPQMIARAYRKYTLKSRRLAYQRGLDDQQEQQLRSL
jgi:hypothetical protein